MLDAVDAGLDGRDDRLRAVGVRGDPQAAPMRFVDDRAEFLVGVVLGSGGAAVRHDPARRADLDELRAVLDLVADCLADLVDAVGEDQVQNIIACAFAEVRDDR